MSPPALPLLTETKETLAGVQKTYACRVLTRAPGHVVLLFVSDRTMRVHDLVLPPGTVTFGYFWADRSYNVYHWMTPAGATMGLYFNVAEGTVIAEQTLFWRDLVVDVLIRPSGEVIVLDEDELPADLSPARRALVADTRDSLIANAPQLLAELTARSAALWPQVPA